METLKISLENCYGIGGFDYLFNFKVGEKKPKQRAYAIYAPNGFMKTSFSKTLDDISQNRQPKEERYGRRSSFYFDVDGTPIIPDQIYVLKSEIDFSKENSAVTDILVKPEHKERYDEIMINIEGVKKKIIHQLNLKSKVKKENIINCMLKDFNLSVFDEVLSICLNKECDHDLSKFKYGVIFDYEVVEFIQSHNFRENAEDFCKKYQETFDSSGNIFKKGIFNPNKAETVFNSLERHGYFKCGHRIHLNGDLESLTVDDLNKKFASALQHINNNPQLKDLKNKLQKNSKYQSLIELIEELDINELDFFLQKIKLENIKDFKKLLWIYYINNTKEAKEYLEIYDDYREEIIRIESEASEVNDQWNKAVELFNDRFIDMPFEISVSNNKEVALGIDNVTKINFIFKDGFDQVSWNKNEVKTLSQGEKRALYLLNFIFEVEARKLKQQKTLFIIDDVADSFDYKNKYAIVQYLKDLCKQSYFYQIVLTHNFDFFRTLSNEFVHRERCLMANKYENIISLEQAEGVKNYFIGKWKKKVNSNNIILCATIPFSRNLIEYLRGEDDSNYLKLTSLLHFKSDSESITVGDYFSIYNTLFGTDYNIFNNKKVIDLIFNEAENIKQSSSNEGLNLENKVLLSIAIRLKTELFLLSEIRFLKNLDDYWCEEKNQFGFLLKEYEELVPGNSNLRILEKVSITVSSNIHLNSFMYEPILDLDIEHLKKLYDEVCALSVTTIVLT